MFSLCPFVPKIIAKKFPKPYKLILTQFEVMQQYKCCDSSSRVNLHKVEEGFVTIEDRKIKYLRTGTGQHTVLCFPGGLGSAWTDFRHQILSLDRNKLSLVIWDPPGYGQSRPPGKDLKPGFQLRDALLAIGLMKALNTPIFSVLAWSAGAVPAIVVAAKFPESINKVVLWGAITYVSDYEVEVFRKLRDVTTWSESARAPLVELYGFEEFRSMWEAWMDTLIRINRENAGDVCLQELRQIRCPLLLIHGNKDPIVSGDQARHIIRTVPGAQSYFFEEGKHNVHMRYHEEFNSIVMDFLMDSSKP